MTTSYAEFLASKERKVQAIGHSIDAGDIHPMLHDWQARIVTWAVQTGRAAIWADTGLGKTLMQVEWARLSGQRALIVAPLAVCQQTVREAARIGVEARYVRAEEDAAGPGLWVTNYEMATRFTPSALDAVVLDEASILKASDGKTRTALIEHFAPVKHRLACTATPAPNDIEELTNQAEFLGVIPRVEMLASYFVHDQDGWRLKGHARGPMFTWMASWAVAIRRPSDLGYPDAGYDLPGLEILPHLLPVDVVPEGQLFATDLGGVGGRAKIRKATLNARCEQAKAIIDESHGWQRVGTKLAAWDGSPNTPRIAEPSTTLTRLSESDERLKGEPPKRTASTCASTTSRTRRSSSSTSATPQSGATLDGESGTPPTLSSELNASGSPSSATRSPSGITGCASSTESPLPSTTSSSNSRAAGAPSAECRSATSQADVSPSTTATTLVGSAASSVENATSVSGSSKTTRSSSGEQSSTYSNPEPWIVWCGLNDEQDHLALAFGDRCFSVTGGMSPEEKAEAILRWVEGERPILITKPKIAGFGMNFQHCARMVFVGLSDSYEQYYQAIRRCYRYGQTRPVHAHVVLSELEGQIASNIARKEREASHITESLVRQMRTAAHWRAA